MIRRLLSAALLTITFAAAAAAAQEPVVTAPAGTVRGTTDGEIRVFKGMPYAAPPLGDLRWKPPQPLARWSGEMPARKFGHACVQPQPQAVSIYADQAMPMSEDCLTLNVWTPKNAKDAPVFVWIHGGSLLAGSSREAIYDGRRLAERGIIVVSINYRLGALGWLAHPELSAETSERVSGNYGLLDQIAALGWVRDNIRSFGGDPRNVTIAGESAGALSTLLLMSSPRAKGLFHRAIAQSAYMISMPALTTSVHGAPAAEAAGAAVATALGAPDIASLRKLDAQDLTNRASRTGFFSFGVVDGAVLPRQMVEAFDQGKQAGVPVLAGFNEGEIRSLRMLAPKPPETSQAYTAAIRDRYGDLADEFLRLYPASNYRDGILAAPRDALYGWTAERLVRSQTSAGLPSFLYFFDHGYPAADANGLHAFHAAELPYVFGTMDRTPPKWPKIPDTPAERALSDAMLDYWASFTRSGTPTTSSGPAWPAYGTDRHYLYIGERAEARQDLMPGMFALNETVVCRRRAAGGIAWNWNTGLASPKLPPASADC